MAKDTEKDTESSQVEQPVDPERQARWEAFLAKARLVNPTRFDAQKENHEFDVIPASFT